MTFCHSLKAFFESCGIRPEWIEAPHGSLQSIVEALGLRAEQVAVPTVLESRQQAVILAVSPLSRTLDRDRVEALLRREIHIADSRRVQQVFFDAAPASIPPFGSPYRIPSLVDRHLDDVSRVFFQSGVSGWMGSVTRDEFHRLIGTLPKVVISSARPGEAVSRSAPQLAVPAEGVSQDMPVSAVSAVEKLYRLPAMPALAMRVMQCVRDPESSVHDLVSLIELDPSISAQILRYAASAQYGYRGPVASLNDAISRVIGFETVGHIALGIAAGRAFSVPREGPCGLKAFWQHALSCAVLSQLLARCWKPAGGISPETAYLCGLLHNIGLLLLGHLFPAEFQRLNSWMAAHPTQSITDYEQLRRDETAHRHPDAIAWPPGHAELGALLMGVWKLPMPIVAACRHHHVAAGVEDPYVRVVQVANQLLARCGIGDAGQVEQGALPELPGVSPAVLMESVARVAELQADIGELAASLAA